MKVYYIVMKAGVPVDVTHLWHQAQQRAAEWSTPGQEAQIVPVTPTQLELPLEGVK